MKYVDVFPVTFFPIGFIGNWFSLCQCTSFNYVRTYCDPWRLWLIVEVFFFFLLFFEMKKSMKKRVHCLFDWKIIWIKKSICKLSSTSGQWHLFSPSCEQSNKIHLKFAVCASFRWYSHRLHCSIRSVTYRNTYTHIYTDTPTSSLLSSR